MNGMEMLKVNRTKPCYQNPLKLATFLVALSVSNYFNG